MSENLRSGFGFLFPLGALGGFIFSLIAEQYVLGIIFVVAGILGWFVYMAVMEITTPSETGNIIILFGTLLSVGVFLSYGLSQNMFGGLELSPEGGLMSLIILFFTVLLGFAFKRTLSPNNNAHKLTGHEQSLVREALEGDSDDNTKVIVLKQEEDASSEEEDEWDYESYNPYMYAYPPEYYGDEYEYEEEEEE
ncbi:MAG: hypothetical protein QF845_03775 [Candidatus Marinimicrobia bacterium]|nr:hypothetical protein [Candidatus Neomarinimicrobiota bacterium]MDP6789634.1 hypothetical protein [Candidatus Neomarinimicrobiota bacterium]MDP7072332.1 hypothetical protein [Candidatus Neomarinimicrobiota bacterium]